MNAQKSKAYKAALSWYVDQGVDIALGDAATDYTKIKTKNVSPKPAPASVKTRLDAQTLEQAQSDLLGASDAKVEAIKLANAANSLEELKAAIEKFDGISLKKTATNMVFSDGNPEAKIMLVGEAPGADEDRQGKPFVGRSGQLLDKILNSIDLARDHETLERSVYISNILNWRPPGNRTPNPAEIEVSLPFIERHIALVKPHILILCGGVPAKALLGKSDSISRLRNGWHNYQTLTPGLNDSASEILAIATYHPSYLLRNPAQKRAVWQDMLSLKAKLEESFKA